MSNPLISVNLVVLNGEKYIRHCLDAVLTQTCPRELVEFNILDNNSTDNTVKIIEGFKFEERGFKKFNLIKSPKNLGVWPGQEELLKYTNGKYVVALCVDVMLDKDFVKNAVEALEKDAKIGALQPKIYKFDLRPTSTEFLGRLKHGQETTPRNVHGTSDVKVLPSRTSQIDTCGFQIFRSRRIVNVGHGETDAGQYDDLGEIFAVEGAVPVFRKEALESCRISIPYSIFHIPYSEIADHDFFWYSDDLDLAWRMQLFGWKQVFAPNVIAWHDRQTTKSTKKSWSDYITRVPIRRQIPIKKRRLDWRNMRWTLVKNDYTINILKDLPWIVSREIAVLGYAILFEPGVLKEIPTFFKYLPKMLRKRREIMKRAVVSPKEMRSWFK